MRNTVRYIGGAFGLAICSSILSNVSLKYVHSKDPSLQMSQVNSLGLPAGITTSEREILLDGYMKAIKGIWWFFLAVAVLVSIAGLTVKEVKLREDEKKINKTEAQVLSDDVAQAIMNDTKVNAEADISNTEKTPLDGQDLGSELKKSNHLGKP